MRRMPFILSAVAAGIVAVGSAGAQDAVIISDGPEKIAVTIYPEDLAMITEMRTVDLPAGRSTIELKGVNDRIVPETALVTEFGAMSIERNFDFDLINKAALFENAVGEEVTLFRTYPGSGEVKVERATIISGANGVTFQIGERIESFQCSNLAERVQFDERPPQLQEEPTLTLTVNAEKPGPQRFEFRYLASGFQWSADYILTLKGKRRGSMIGWLTASNDTKTGIDEADLSIVAGEIARLERTRAPEISARGFRAHCVPEGPAPGSLNGRLLVTGRRIERADLNSPLRVASVSSEQLIAEREDLGDYKLYKTPFATTLAARQTKQVLFLDKPKVAFKKRYVFNFSSRYAQAFFDDDIDNDIRVDDADSNDDIKYLAFNAAEQYEIDNSRNGRLAEPLPRGTVRVMTKRAMGERFFLGQGDIENLAVGSPVKVDAGFAGHVVMSSQKSNERRLPAEPGKFRKSYDLEHEFTNMTDERAAIEFSMLIGASQEIKKSSMKPIKENSVATWQFTLPAGAAQLLKLTVETKR